MTPLAALQDDDLELPDRVEYAYCALYNLFRKHALDEAEWTPAFEAVIRDATNS